MPIDIEFAVAVVTVPHPSVLPHYILPGQAAGVNGHGVSHDHHALLSKKTCCGDAVARRHHQVVHVHAPPAADDCG